MGDTDQLRPRSGHRRAAARLASVLLVTATVLSPVALGSLVVRHEVAAPAPVRRAMLHAWAGGATLSRAHEACLTVWLAASDTITARSPSA